MDGRHAPWNARRSPYPAIKSTRESPRTAKIVKSRLDRACGGNRWRVAAPGASLGNTGGNSWAEPFLGNDGSQGPVSEDLTASADLACRPGQVPSDPTIGSQRGFLTLLYSKYRGPLFRYVRGIITSPEEAAELVQETYVRVMRQPEISRFEFAARNYLFETATNLARDHIRRKRHRRHEPLDEEASLVPGASQNEPDRLVAWDQTLETLRVAIESMPPLTRDIFVMGRLRGRKYTQIAAELGVSLRTVERRMGEAMNLLAESLKDAL